MGSSQVHQSVRVRMLREMIEMKRLLLSVALLMVAPAKISRV